MNGLLKDARDLATGLRKELGDNAGGPEVLVCPPFLALDAVRQILDGSPIRLGAQDIHWEAKGAFTGEVSGRCSRRSASPPSSWATASGGT